MCLDLDANTVNFHKNGAAIRLAEAIERDAYNFVFDARREGDAVTIVSVE